MSDQPQRPAEQALRDYAEQRRAQAPPTELHPATRRMLQGEVARTYGAKTAPGVGPAAVPWLATWWGRLALGAPALAAIAVVFFVLNREREMHLAMDTSTVPAGFNELAEAKPAATAPAFEYRTTESKASADTAVALAPAAKPDGLLAGNDLMQRKAPEGPTLIPDRSLRGASLEMLNGAPPPAPAPVPANASAEFARADRRKEATALPSEAARAPLAAGAKVVTSSSVTESESAGLAAVATSPMTPADQAVDKRLGRAEPATAAAPVPAPMTLSSTAGTEFSKLGVPDPAWAGQAMNRQQFVQTEDRAALRRNFNSPAPLPVLNSFHFENAGYAVLITDADGSVYSGQIVGMADPAGFAPVQSTAASERQNVAPTARAATASKSETATGFGGSVRQLQQSPALQTVYFRVQGTNLTMQQAVEFEGNLLLPAPGTSQNRGAGQRQPAPTPALLQQGIIQGRALIGGRTQLDVRAGAAP